MSMKNLPAPMDIEVRPMAFRRADGLIELVHPYTGEVLAVQKDAAASLEKTPDRYQPVELPNGEVRYLEKTLDSGIFGNARKSWARNAVLEDLICQQLANGENIKDICKTPGFPTLSVFSKWMQDPEFKGRVSEARAMRAEVLKEEVLYQADQAIAEAEPEQSVAARKLKVDALKWVASVDSPDRFGNKTKVENSSTSTILIIDTGIRREDGAAKDAPETIDVTNDAPASPAVMTVLPPMEKGAYGEDYVETELLESSAGVGGSGDSAAN